MGIHCSDPYICPLVLLVWYYKIEVDIPTSEMIKILGECPLATGSGSCEVDPKGPASTLGLAPPCVLASERDSIPTLRSKWVPNGTPSMRSLIGPRVMVIPRLAKF